MSNQVKLHKTVPQGLKLIAKEILAVVAILGMSTMTVHAAVGAKIGLQNWDPAHPDKEHVAVAYDNATEISDAVIKAWELTRNQFHDLVVSELGAPDRLKKGVTLYDIDLRLQPSSDFTAKQTGPNKLEFTYVIRHNTLIATSTTPDIAMGAGVGQYADPRVSVDFDVVLQLGVELQPATDKTLVITGIKAHIENTKVDSQNAAADILKALNGISDYFGGPNFIAKAERLLNGISVGAMNTQPGQPQNSFIVKANAMLAPVNKAFSIPGQYIKVGAWYHKNKVVLAFSPRNIPQPQATGAIEGHVRWPNSWVAKQGCSSFNVKSRVQIAPSLITGPDFTLGNGPIKEYGQFIPVGNPTLSGNNYECQYRLSGVPIQYGNALAATSTGFIDPSQKPVSTSASVNSPFQLTSLKQDGWTEQYVVPPANATNRDYLVVGLTVRPHVQYMEKVILKPKTAENVMNSRMSAAPVAKVHTVPVAVAPAKASTAQKTKMGMKTGPNQQLLMAPATFK